MSKSTFITLMSVPLFLSCGAPQSHGTQSELLSGWDFFNNPELMENETPLERNFSKLPVDGKLENEPWSDDYWPSQFGGIAHRWNHPAPMMFKYTSPTLQQVQAMTSEELMQLSPAEKFDIYEGRYDFPTVKAEWARTGVRSLSWEGLCDGIAMVSLLLPEPRPTLIRGAHGISVPFGSSDVKALLAYADMVLVPSSRRSVGSWCRAGFLPESDACSDVNAAVFHIILSNEIGLHKRGFVADVDPGKEIWNHPAFGFNTKILERRSGRSQRAATTTVEEITLETVVSYAPISAAPQWSTVQGAAPLTKTYRYTLELDEKQTIVGGEWLTEEHPDVLWVTWLNHERFPRSILNIYEHARH
jgi:hypothetical protein